MKALGILLALLCSCAAVNDQAYETNATISPKQITAPVAGDGVKLLRFFIQPQPNDKWCWATVISSAVEWATGSAPKVCEVVSKANNWIYKEVMDCCVETPDPRCNRPGSSIDLLLALQIDSKLTLEFHRYGLSWRDTVEEIDAGHPIIVAREYLMNAGHTQVIIGYNKAHRSVYAFEPTGGLVVEVPYHVFLYHITYGGWSNSFVLFGANDKFWQGDFVR